MAANDLKRYRRRLQTNKFSSIATSWVTAPSSKLSDTKYAEAYRRRRYCRKWGADYDCPRQYINRHDKYSHLPSSDLDTINDHYSDALLYPHLTPADVHLQEADSALRSCWKSVQAFVKATGSRFPRRRKWTSSTGTAYHQSRCDVFVAEKFLPGSYSSSSPSSSSSTTHKSDVESLHLAASGRGARSITTATTTTQDNARSPPPPHPPQTRPDGPRGSRRQPGQGAELNVFNRPIRVTVLEGTCLTPIDGYMILKCFPLSSVSTTSGGTTDTHDFTVKLELRLEGERDPFSGVKKPFYAFNEGRHGIFHVQQWVDFPSSASSQSSQEDSVAMDESLARQFTVKIRSQHLTHASKLFKDNHVSSFKVFLEN